jgi:hypothetical protein
MGIHWIKRTSQENNGYVANNKWPTGLLEREGVGEGFLMCVPG